MKDDAELDIYSMREEVDEDSDAMVMMKDDAELNTYSPGGDETKVKMSKLGEKLGICDTVCTEVERYLVWTSMR
jgi:hypothetical protein